MSSLKQPSLPGNSLEQNVGDDVDASTTTRMATMCTTEMERSDTDPLASSAPTTGTLTGSVPEREQPEEESELEGEEMGFGWFGDIRSDFKNIAYSIKDNVPPAIGDIANFVHRTALSVAAEIAKLEVEEEEANKHNSNFVNNNNNHFGEDDDDHDYEYNHEDSAEPRTTGDNKNRGLRGERNSHVTSSLSEHNSDVTSSFSSLRLPWEIQYRVENVYKEDIDLKQKILALSRQESTFLSPFSHRKNTSSVASSSPSSLESQNVTSSSFVLDEPRVRLIHRLMEIDPNLASMHARLSARNDIAETFFWRNYFYHCEQTTAGSHIQKGTDGENHLHQEQHYKKRDDIESEDDDVALHSEGKTSTSMNASAPTPSLNMEDDDSLVELTDDDTASYVNIASAPCSLNSLTEIRSVEDLVLVGKEPPDREITDNGDKF